MTEPRLRPLEPLTPTLVRDLLRASNEELVEAFRLADVARRVEVFLQLRPSERESVFQKLPDGMLEGIVRMADSASVADPLRAVGPERARILVSGLQPDELADVILHLPEEFRKSVLDGLPTAPEVESLLRYPEGTAGAMMNTRYVSVPEVVTVARALDLVRQAAKAETVNYIYVVDSAGKLLGTISVRNLLVASPRATVSDVATKQIVKIPVTATHEELVQSFQTHKFLALPVVDDKERMVGVVTFDDVMGALREEEDRLVYSVTGVNPREHLVEGARAARGRIPWISSTILGGFLCAGIGTIFKQPIQQILVLGLFVPLVLAIGESVGSQTAAIVMKTLVTGAVRKAQLAGFLWKELAIGLLVGVYAGLIVGALSLLWELRAAVAVVVGGAVWLSVAWASILGVSIPYLLRRLKVDPAIASGPVVLLLCDLSTLLFYLGGAQLVLL